MSRKKFLSDFLRLENKKGHLNKFAIKLIFKICTTSLQTLNKNEKQKFQAVSTEPLFRPKFEDDS